MTHSEEKEDFWGNKYTQHQDDKGNETGRSEDKEGFWGNKYRHTESNSSSSRSSIGQSRRSGHTGSSGHNSGSSSGSSWCYLTTACVEVMKLPDDCYELQTLRKFRDEYVMRKQNGAELIQEYYTTAPKIISAIKSNEDSDNVFRSFYSDIKNAVTLIEEGKNEEAYQLYTNFAVKLKRQHLE